MVGLSRCDVDVFLEQIFKGHVRRSMYQEMGEECLNGTEYVILTWVSFSR